MVPLPESPDTPTPTPEKRLEKQRNLLRAFEEERRQARDAREQAQHDKAERQSNCNLARDRLLSYENSSGIYALDAAGERVYLDTAQREQFIAERRKDVESWCGKP
jgi:cell division protein FtsN